MELLKTEYLHLQSTIEGGDGKALTIKAWSVPFSFAAFGVAFTSHSVIIFIIAACGSGIFWFLEALWKTFQIAHYERKYEIECYFRNKIKKIKVLQITESSIKEFQKGDSTNHSKSCVATCLSTTYHRNYHGIDAILGNQFSNRYQLTKTVLLQTTKLKLE